MSAIISIPFQEKVTTRFSGSEEGVTELRTHPFIAGQENYVLCSVVYDVIQDYPNPFAMLIHGPLGFGKSHLTEGLLIAWFGRHPGAKVKLVSARDFARSWAQAQRTRTTHEFFEEYHTLDFFVLDELQEIATHTATQEQLVQTLDLLLRRGARVFLTANQPLAALTLIPKLASRLRQGVSIEIHLPAPETRRRILTQTEISRNVPISESALDEFVALADREELSVGEMLQRFQKMEWIRKTRQENEIQSESVSKVFAGSEENVPVTVAQIAKLAAKFYKVKLTDLRSKSRKTVLVTVRDVVYCMARRLTDATLDEIGTYFGGRDHTTILHGCAQAESLIESDEEVRRCVDFLLSELKSGR
ncbi:MAG: ATP-binding protein [Thermoguttaceae bacterium]|nr:ATP-binding protein [Thermoguttaceae bacterium]